VRSNMQRLLRLPIDEERCACRSPCHDRHGCLRWRAYDYPGTPLADYSFERGETCDHFLEIPSDKDAP
jgi:hypothetical protein